jgi:hypothetical protein
MLDFKKNGNTQEPAQTPFWEDESDLGIYGRPLILTKLSTNLIKISWILMIGLTSL